jgi:hypothetical protein
MWEVRRILSPDIHQGGWQKYLDEKDVQVYSFPQQVEGGWKQAIIACNENFGIVIYLEDNFIAHLLKPTEEFLSALHTFDIKTDKASLMSYDSLWNDDIQERGKMIAGGITHWDLPKNPMLESVGI